MRLTDHDYTVIVRTTTAVLSAMGVTLPVEPEDIAHDLVERILHDDMQIDDVSAWCWSAARRRVVDAFRHARIVARKLTIVHLQEVQRRVATRAMNQEELAIAREHLQQIAARLPREVPHLFCDESTTVVDKRRRFRARSRVQNAIKCGPLQHVDLRPTPDYSSDAYI